VKEGVLMDKLNPTIDDINTEYFIAPRGGVTFICHETTDEEGKATLVYLTEASFKLALKNKGQFFSTPRGNLWRGIGDLWLQSQSPQRREYKGVIFSPQKDLGKDYYNLWTGFSVTPLPGEPTPFLEFIHFTICNKNDDYYNYLLSWMADVVQNLDPKKKPGVALALRGTKGVGKTFFSENFGRLFGRHFRLIESSEQLIGRFNTWAQDCILLLADEIGWAGDRHSVGRLQSLITDPTISIEPKGVDRFHAPNFVHVIMCGNDARAVPASTDERRYFLLDVSDIHQNDHPYFQKLADYMDQKGAGELLNYLQKYDLKGRELRKVPLTDALTENIDLGMTTVQLFWKDHIEREQLPHLDPFNPSIPWTDNLPPLLDKGSIHSLYEDEEQRHRRRPATRELFWAETKRMLKLPKIDPQPRSTKQKRCVQLPPISEAQRLFEKSRNPMKGGGSL
jgi:hypothetical protein